MTFAWLKRYAPRSLYGRTALILLTPVIAIQIVVSVVFVQRYYEDVTEQMSRNVALELRYMRDLVDGAPDVMATHGAIDRLAGALRFHLEFPDPDPVTKDTRQFYDLSGRVLIRTLRSDLDGVLGVSLTRREKRVVMSMTTRLGPLTFDFPRSRMSASNPHQLLVLMTGVSIFATVIAFLFLRNQVRPIRRLARAAEDFGRGRVTPYWPSGATEVRAAGNAFLDMRSRIERQIEQRTLMLSGVSHDLRTPLTRLKLGLSMLDDPLGETEALLGDLRDMEAMLDSFLDFASSESLDDMELVDPEALLAQVAEGARRAGQNVTLADCGASDGAERTRVRMSPLAVRRALENLVNNGVRHGTRVELSCHVSERAVVFSVEDDGPGIPPDQRGEALKPFKRLDAARGQNRGGGVGLGLSIAVEIARRHGGTLRLEESARLGGLRADLLLAR